jgi:trehalose utilization protein
VTANVDSMDGKAQIGFHNESRVDEVRVHGVHTRRLAKANRLIWWIGLLFGKVESVSGTNKAWSKILKLRT